MLTLSQDQNLNCTISYVLERLSSFDVAQFLPSFDNLPRDPYLDGNYRFRRFSHFKISNHHLVQLPHIAFLQSKTYNPLLGDVTREYLELDDALIHLPAFQTLVLEFFEFCQRCSTFDEVGVHQIRITANENAGNPAPEGIHRDGVDLIGIACIHREHIDGGETHLYPSKHHTPDQKPAFTKILEPGELLVVDDRQFFHFTTPVKAQSPQGGFRDVFVFTCPGLPHNQR
ncbi:2OG-Fe dioxygenase family protein [Oscillatoria sp. FACHB-1407]|uniref:2OG-Fe dioxygenase family protein n=1 Tax=Oscillatoria sp. FACHB-1407 TaxID=2692847 RepID=UPI0016834F11|nr:2OG-Fe dioxygenase family protein [Oscillatoria sp. FACHB-1407]MBD2465202.1 2OG-Fe dioxygenase family protein [Oscillatoria sp. FACHB-1407]